VYDPLIGGKRWVGSFDRLSDAKAAERKAASEVADSRGRPDRTVVLYAERWLDVHHGPGTRRKRESTRRHNEEMLRPFIAEFGQRSMRSFSHSEAIDWSRARRHNAKVVGAMFNDAVREDLCDRNPFQNMGLPGSKGRSEIVPLTDAEVERLGQIALDRYGDYGPMCRAWILFAAWVGCRPGEMFKLEWADLDLEAGLVRIDASKTDRVRVVVVPPKAQEALLAMRRIRRGLLFVTSTGKPVRKGAYSFYWDPVRTAFAAGLDAERRVKLLHGRDNIDLYELRHHAASRLADQGLDERDISYQLGNSPEVCKVYVHHYEDRVLNRLRAAHGMNVQPLRRAAG
jgi:integrase